MKSQLGDIEFVRERFHELSDNLQQLMDFETIKERSKKRIFCKFSQNYLLKDWLIFCVNLIRNRNI